MHLNTNQVHLGSSVCVSDDVAEIKFYLPTATGPQRATDKQGKHISISCIISALVAVILNIYKKMTYKCSVMGGTKSFILQWTHTWWVLVRRTRTCTVNAEQPQKEQLNILQHHTN